MPPSDSHAQGEVPPPTGTMVTNGKCLEGTLENLAQGYGARPLSADSLEKAKKDALELLNQVLVAYEASVSPGEVGAKGTAQATATSPVAGRCPTGLLYGRVQSGKTVAMITFSAAALDNGFRVIIVLTSDYLKLVEQTAARFSALAGPLVKHSNAIETWQPDAAHMAKQIGTHGLVLVCAKNQKHLKTLVDFLQSVGASKYPALILDDEADQATLDTTTSARAAQKPSAPRHGSAINRRTVRNDAPWEEGESIRERLPHHVFLQVTATPYALLLQNSDNQLRPSFTRLLEPATGYTGGEAFFDEHHLADEGKPPLVFVHENESQLIESGADEAPLGLKQAIAFFLVSAAAQRVLDKATRVQGQNFLCHTSPKTAEHDRSADLIRKFLGRLGDDVNQSDVPGESGIRLAWAYNEFCKTLSNAPSFSDILNIIRQRLPRREIPVVNSANSPAEFGREWNFIVGGNILGRGLTIDNLLVTYYLRRAKTSQMDTVLQHARMFGYRQTLMPFTRVFLPESLAFRFHFIHVAEKRLRTLLVTTNPRSRILVEATLGLRATRPNVLDTGSLSAYSAGEQVYPVAPALDVKSLSRNAKIESTAKAALGGELRTKEFIEASIESIIGLMHMVPYPEDDAGNWDPETLAKILRAISERYAGRAFVYYRTMERRKPRLATGAASGAEVHEAHLKGTPVLLLFKDTGKYLGQECWYPTLVLPEDMPTQVFNVT